MDSCSFETRTVQPVVSHYTVNAIAYAKLMFVRLTLENVCGSGATLLKVRKQTRQLEFRETKIETFVFVEFHSWSIVSDIKKN